MSEPRTKEEFTAAVMERTGNQYSGSMALAARRGTEADDRLLSA